MLDIISVPDSGDLVIRDSSVMKGKNVLTTQRGSLHFEPNFGCDLKFFIDSPYQFKEKSFTTYCIQQLTENYVEVSELIEFVNTLAKKNTFSVDNTALNFGNNGGLIA